MIELDALSFVLFSNYVWGHSTSEFGSYLPARYVTLSFQLPPSGLDLPTSCSRHPRISVLSCVGLVAPTNHYNQGSRARPLPPLNTSDNSAQYDPASSYSVNSNAQRLVLSGLSSNNEQPFESGYDQTISLDGESRLHAGLRHSSR